MSPRAPNRQDSATGATTSEKAPSFESASKHREKFPPGNIGGGGGNRTHVRWTVLARHYERSLRFIFARRKPTGGPLARLVRFCSPLTPTNLRVPGKLAWFTPKPTALARSGGRRYLRSECQRCFVGSYTGARFVEITRLGSRLAAPGPPSRPFAPTMTRTVIIPDCQLQRKSHQPQTCPPLADSAGLFAFGRSRTCLRAAPSEPANERTAGRGHAGALRLPAHPFAERPLLLPLGLSLGDGPALVVLPSAPAQA